MTQPDEAQVVVQLKTIHELDTARAADDLARTSQVLSSPVIRTSLPGLLPVGVVILIVGIVAALATMNATSRSGQAANATAGASSSAVVPSMTAAASAPATASPPPATESAPSAGESSSAPSVALGPEHRVAWKTNVVSLKAKNLVITADDRRFAPPAVVDLHSDAGDARYWTLEATWFEAGIEMRMNVYFAADDTDWWATEIRTYNGRDPADWIEYGGTFFKSPLGKPYTGDLDISSTDPTPGRLMIKGLVLKVDR